MKMRWCIFTHQGLLDTPSLWSLPIQGDGDVMMMMIIIIIIIILSCYEAFLENFILVSILPSEIKPTGNIRLSNHKYEV